MSTDSAHDKRLLLGVLSHELDAQERKRTKLVEQLEMAGGGGSTEEDLDDAKARKAREKALRRAEKVPARLAEVDAAQECLRELMQATRERGADLGRVRATAIEELGLGKRLETFDVNVMGRRQIGRPDGFDGLVFESPRGIPILVARQQFKDVVLRRVGRGKDLFFQVREPRGSRVLLRTSMRLSLIHI